MENLLELLGLRIPNQVTLNNKNYKFTDQKLEGIFVMNTPTFIMYNNQYRIYSLKSFRELIERTFKDIEFTFAYETNDETSIITVNYPYFKKPEYLVFKDDDDQ